MRLDFNNGGDDGGGNDENTGNGNYGGGADNDDNTGTDGGGNDGDNDDNDDNTTKRGRSIRDGSLSSSHSSMPSLVDGPGVGPLTRSRSDPGFDEYSDEYRVAQREELRRARHTAKTV